jgi:hypothetical protein
MKTSTIPTNTLVILLVLGVLTLLSWLVLPASSGPVLTAIFGSTFLVCTIALIIKQRRKSMPTKR